MLNAFGCFIQSTWSGIEIMQNVWLGHALLGTNVKMSMFCYRQFEPACPKCHFVWQKMKREYKKLF